MKLPIFLCLSVGSATTLADVETKPLDTGYEIVVAAESRDGIVPDLPSTEEDSLLADPVDPHTHLAVTNSNDYSKNSSEIQSSEEIVTNHRRAADENYIEILFSEDRQELSDEKREKLHNCSPHVELLETFFWIIIAAIILRVGLNLGFKL